MLARRRVVLVDRVLAHGHDPRVPGAPRVGLGEPLGQRPLPRPPAVVRHLHDLPEAPAVAVRENGQVVDMSELVQEHRARLLDPGPHVDHPRLAGVHAAGHLRQPRAPLEPQRHRAHHGRYERLRGPALPLAGKWPTTWAHEPNRALGRQRRRFRGTQNRQAEKHAQAREYDDRGEPSQHHPAVYHSSRAFVAGSVVERPMRVGSHRPRSILAAGFAAHGTRGRLAQLVRAPALQAGGRAFEPRTAHSRPRRATVSIAHPRGDRRIRAQITRGDPAAKC